MYTFPTGAMSIVNYKNTQHRQSTSRIYTQRDNLLSGNSLHVYYVCVSIYWALYYGISYNKVYTQYRYVDAFMHVFLTYI